LGAVFFFSVPETLGASLSISQGSFLAIVEEVEKTVMLP
jgi:hypothetical protein